MNNNLQTHDQNMVEYKNNNTTNSTNENNDNAYNGDNNNDNNNNYNHNNNDNNHNNNNNNENRGENNNKNGNNNYNDHNTQLRVSRCQRFMSAFNYNIIDYRNDFYVSIGNINFKCNYCHAFKWSEEPPSLICSRENVLMAGIVDPLESLKNLLNHSYSDSKYFFIMIRVYNFTFQMTSFGAN